MVTSFGTHPIPVVLIKILSQLPLSTTFVSPVTIVTPACPAASAMADIIRCRSLMGNPSSRIKPALRPSGWAPVMQISFTVPLIARSPMLPPGKKIGSTTNESVVKANRPSGTCRIAWSSRRLRISLPSKGKKSSLIRSAESLPPLPCASWIVSCSIIGMGQEEENVSTIGSSIIILIIGCASPFTGNHCRSKWMFRAAFPAKCRTG